jgi:phosphoenolpyruvate-protein kinase (PTS system EI component)
MSPASILDIRGRIQGLVKSTCEELVVKTLALKTAGEIEEFLKIS